MNSGADGLDGNDVTDALRWADHLPVAEVLND
jgi:hypothetical protein